MNLLIVDDEYYSVEGLKNSCNWSEFGIDQILCAYSFKHAQTIFAENVIDIMIADIEMPHGSGIDLLEWLKEQNFNTITFFLTSHAKYEYVSHALKLGAVDYLLKPVDEKQLEITLQKAITKTNEQKAQQQEHQYANSWKRNRFRLLEQFWLELLSSENLSLNRHSIVQTLQHHHISEELLKQNFYLALLSIYIPPKDNTWSQGLYAFSVKNIINEFLLLNNPSSAVISCYNNRYFICSSCCLYQNFQLFQEKCNALLEELSCVLPGSFRLYLCPETEFFSINTNYHRLDIISKNDIYTDSAVIVPESNASFSNLPASNFNWKKLDELITSFRISDADQFIYNYFHDNRNHRFIDRNFLSAFVHNFLQLIYASLEHLGCSAHSLLNAPDMQESFEHAFENVAAMELWTTQVLKHYQDYIKTQIQTDSPIESVKQYIQEHLSEDLNRETLAALVYLSPDHLSHLFNEYFALPTPPIRF